MWYLISFNVSALNAHDLHFKSSFARVFPEESVDPFEPAMEQFNLNHSAKDIPVPAQKGYINMMINSIETLVYNMSWAAEIFLRPKNVITKETFNFKSNKKPPKVPELEPFKETMLNIVKNIKFRNGRSKFQRQLQSEKVTIKNDDKLIVAADKTSNHYKMSAQEYTNTVKKNVNDEYKISTARNVKKVTASHKAIVNELDIEDRVFKTSDREAFISLKDHKADFRNKPKSRLLNPMKPEIGQVSHLILKKIVRTVRAKSGLNQWENVYSCINWFEKLTHKSRKSFIVFDIVNFYPSISEEMLSSALNWALKYISISDQERKVIFDARKSFLFFNGAHWEKKENSNFDVTMGSYDGAEVCDICGLYILSLLKNLNLNVDFGSYKDDGLAATSSSPRQAENIKKKICEVFRKLGLKITIEANKKCVAFLDAEFNLNDSTFKPYLKPGDCPTYVNAGSNHPPNILKNIPVSINRRLSALSSNENMFLSVAPMYQRALDRAGYDYRLHYNPPAPNNQPKKRQRSRKVIWWNPPFSSNVKTKVGNLFFQAIEQHFGKDSPLHKCFNKHTLKMSYRTTPNFKRIISSHNKKLLRGENVDPPCKCKIGECLVNGQ